jgi:hypothetical protein
VRGWTGCQADLLPLPLLLLHVLCPRSFWPQVFANYMRKSVEGLSFDYTGEHVVAAISAGANLLHLRDTLVACLRDRSLMSVFVCCTYTWPSCFSDPCHCHCRLPTPHPPPAVLNVLGFACYTQFNLSLFLSPVVKQEYRLRFGTPDIPVELNDVVFGLHALVMSCVLALQCIVYPKHDTQRVSIGTSISMAVAAATGLGLASYLVVSGEGRPPMTWLDL